MMTVICVCVILHLKGHAFVKLCQIVGDELFFFTWRIFLKVGKAQDLPSKIWQTLGDALIRVAFDVICS
jgi:hypothetical protein